MEASSPPTTEIPTRLYYQLVYTLTRLLPPPIDDSPAALRARNHSAVAKVAALLPVNANEIDLAAQCIAARAQAEEMLRLTREHADDIALVMRLNAQYASMVRTSLAVEGRLMRIQAIRQKREAIEDAATRDAWTQHIAERSMLNVVELEFKPPQPAAPQAANPPQAEAPQAATTPPQPEPPTPEAAAAAPVDTSFDDDDFRYTDYSTDPGFEAMMRAFAGEIRPGETLEIAVYRRARELSDAARAAEGDAAEGIEIPEHPETPPPAQPNPPPP